MNDVIKLAGRTAIARRQASVPARLLCEYLEERINIDSIKRFETIFDWGCGKGADIKYLKEHFHFVDGWDPVYKPSPTPAEMKDRYNGWEFVLLTYVLNVIPKDMRMDTLKQIAEFILPYGQCLITVRSVSQVEYAKTAKWGTFEDMYVTTRGTYQRGFEGHEIATMALDAGFAGAHLVSKDPVMVMAYHQETIDSDEVLM